MIYFYLYHLIKNISFEEDFCNKYNNVKCYAHDGTINNIKIENKNMNFIKKIYHLKKQIIQQICANI